MILLLIKNWHEECEFVLPSCEYNSKVMRLHSICENYFNNIELTLKEGTMVYFNTEMELRLNYCFDSHRFKKTYDHEVTEAAQLGFIKTMRILKSYEYSSFKDRYCEK